MTLGISNGTVTVDAATLTVGGAIGDGSLGYSLTKAGSGAWRSAAPTPSVAA